MDKRLILHSKLLEIADKMGLKKVYFQPPSNVKIEYPCILYELSNIQQTRADNISYLNNCSYQLSVVTTNPNIDVTKDILNEFKYSSFERVYISDNLYHYVITIYQIL